MRSTTPDSADASQTPEDVAPIDALFAPRPPSSAIRRIPRAALVALRTVRAAAPGTLLRANLLQVASAALVAVQLLAIKYVVEQLLVFANAPDNSVAALLPAFGALFATGALTGLIGALLAKQQEWMDELVSLRVFDGIIDVSARVKLALFEDPAFYDELERATSAGLRRPTEMVNSLMAVLLGVLTSGGIVVVLLTIEPLLVPLVGLAGLPPLLATLSTSRRTYAFEYGMTTHARERFHLFELFTEREPAKELRVFSAIGFLRARYASLTEERLARYGTFLSQRLRVSIAAALAAAAGSAIALGALAWLLATGRTGVASAATAALAMQLLGSRLTGVIGGLGKLVESSLFMEDLDAFLSLGRRGPAATEAEDADGDAPPFDTLEVSDLTFTYPQTREPVLHDVSLEVRRGEVVALVGENGSGKTTLVKLLCQLYDAPPGTLRWNGRDVDAVDPGEIRDQMTVLFQDFVQYYMSVEDNIALGRASRPRDPEAVRDAARRAGVHDMVERLPDGYQTRLGRQFLGGTELSGGQWQRLALARAFYRGGDFLVMDEPTAALDPRAEYNLFEQLRELARGKSVLLISHRFANVRMADRIYVLEGGRIAEHGSHGELMAHDGLYAELFRLQASSYADA